MVLGLDGVPHELLVHLFDNGIMPNFARLADSSVFKKCYSTLPPISSVAWTTFSTAVDPKDHGIFGFTDFKERSLSLRFPSFDDVKVEPIWQTLGHKGLRSIIVNLPFTYPARPLNGVLIAGFVAPVFERSIYPDSYIPWLKGLNYKIDVDLEKGRTDKKQLIYQLFQSLDLREKVILDLTRSEPWDLFIGVVTGTDRLHHFFYDAAFDPDHPFYEVFVNYYRKFDGFIGRLLNSIGNLSGFIALSDHGFTRLHSQVYLNTILRRKGYLNFNSNQGSRLEDITRDSLAVALDPTRIYTIHQGRFRESNRSEKEGPIITANIKRDLGKITLGDIDLILPEQADDTPVFDTIFDSQSLFGNSDQYDLPDLICLPVKGVDVKATLGVDALSGKDIFTGAHTWDNGFLMARGFSEEEVGPEPSVKDASRLVLSRFNQGIIA